MKFRFSCLLVLPVLLLGLDWHAASAQENDRWVPDSLTASVTELLRNYEFCHNSLTSDSDPDKEISFIRLFANPKILVLNDFASDSATRKISIQDYSTYILESFPKGVTVRLLFSSLTIGKPHYDRNDRYILKARISQSKTGISSGKVLTSIKTIVFHVAFTWTGDKAIDFEIYGIDEAPVQRDVLGIEAGPRLSVITNSDIIDDERFGVVYRPGYQVSFHYSHYFNAHWGLSAGIRYGLMESSLRLDSIDPFGGFNPGFSDVIFLNRLWQISVPVLLSWQHRFTSSWAAYADAGPMLSMRLFEKQQVSGFNESRGMTLNNIISDPDWISGLNRMSLDFFINVGLMLRINPNIELGAGLGIVQGLSSLDHHVQHNFESAKYQGQYNPLWGSDKATTARSAALNLRLNVTLKNESER